jgi:hypothetical protein
MAAGTSGAAINVGRVVMGGVLAGVIFLVADMGISGTLMRADMEQVAQARNLDMAAMESGAAMASIAVIDILFGLVAVFTYAAIRPRFGPGPTTAAYAGLIVYITATLIAFAYTSMGMFPMSMFAKSSVIYLVVTLVGVEAGAAVYKE